MKITYFESSNGKYPVQFKLFTPDICPVSHVILAVHGFAGGYESGILKMLAEAGQKDGTAVCCFNLPGHNKEKSPPGRLTLANSMEDILFAYKTMTDIYPGLQTGVFATSFGAYCVLLDLEGFPAGVPVILRSPAIAMNKTLLKLLDTDENELSQKRTVDFGRLEIAYDFYLELKANDIAEKDLSRKMLLIHGTADEVVDPADTAAFIAANHLVKDLPIPGAGHRYKNPGELDKVVTAATGWFNYAWD